MASAVITGWGTRLGRPFAARLDLKIREAVLSALSVSGLSIGDIDTVVTVGSDTLDGLSVPSRSEVAGNYGRSYLNLPSSAGHGLGAAVAEIESGAAEHVLLVGWGAAARLAQHDFRRNQADPFYARPIGASPRVMAVLQARELLGFDGLHEGALQGYADEMFSRAWPGEPKPSGGAAPAWASTAFCDGVTAIVLRRSSKSSGGVAVRDFASASRPYSPEDDRLDPAAWAAEAIAGLSDPAARGSSFDVVEAAAPTPAAEVRALAAVGSWSPGSHAMNRSGGGASAHFGAATGLRQIAEASRSLAQAGPDAKGLVLDLAGPIGQHATAILLQSRGNA